MLEFCSDFYQIIEKFRFRGNSAGASVLTSCSKQGQLGDNAKAASAKKVFSLSPFATQPDVPATSLGQLLMLM